MFFAKVGEAVMEGEEGGAEFFFLLVGEIAGIDAAQRLAFDELAQQLDDGEDELQEVFPDGVRVGCQAVGGVGGFVVGGGGAWMSRKAWDRLSPRSWTRPGRGCGDGGCSPLIASALLCPGGGDLGADGDNKGAQGDTDEVDVGDGQDDVAGEDDSAAQEPVEEVDEGDLAAGQGLAVSADGHGDGSGASVGPGAVMAKE